MKAVHRIYRYLKGTKSSRLRLQVGDDERLFNYADADFAANFDDRRSTTGYIIKFGGATVMWRSVAQRCVSLSTLEAECYSLSPSITASLWLRDCLKELLPREVPSEQIQCFEDNASCVALANTESLGRAKHIAIRFHFVKELVQRGDIQVAGISTKQMIADALTKPVPLRKI